MIDAPIVGILGLMIIFQGGCALDTDKYLGALQLVAGSIMVAVQTMEYVLDYVHKPAAETRCFHTVT
jgi:hypothetical protein